MNIINRSDARITCEIYNADDNVPSGFLASFAVPRQPLVDILPGEEQYVDANGSVQIQVMAPPFGYPLAPPRPVIIRASKSNIFDNSMIAVFTLSKTLVKLDQGYAAIVKLRALEPTGENPQPKVDITKILRVLLTIAEALVLTSFSVASTKWVMAGTFKGALALVDIFGPSGQATTTLSIKGISNELKELIENHDAQMKVSAIFEAMEWLDKYIEKSRSIDLSVSDFSDYDRKQFLDELNDHVDGKTSFKNAMYTLRLNRTIRKYAIPSYLLGTVLHLQLEMLNLSAKQASTPIDVADINAVVTLAKLYQQTLPELEEDYVHFCDDLEKQYPLMAGLDKVNYYKTTYSDAPDYPTQPRDVTIQVGPRVEDAPENQKEGFALAQGAIAKYLQGDRMVITKTDEKLSSFITVLLDMKVQE